MFLHMPVISSSLSVHHSEIYIHLLPAGRMLDVKLSLLSVQLLSSKEMLLFSCPPNLSPTSPFPKAERPSSHLRSFFSFQFSQNGCHANPSHYTALPLTLECCSGASRASC
ncbi:uncharacterized [Tachysurus ichikawai]